MALDLPAPRLADAGPTWEFSTPRFRCRLVSTREALRLWVDDVELHPSRVLDPTELEDWAHLEQPHVREHALSVPDKPPRLLSLVVERVLHRHADLLDGVAPPGWFSS